MTVQPPVGVTRGARRILERDYDLEVASLDHLATHSNVLFRADLGDGRRLVLRVGDPGGNTKENLEIEVAWLAELATDPELNIAEPVAARDGRGVVEMEVDERIHPCVLFTWVPGEPIGEGGGVPAYRAMGRISGRLHRHGDWRPAAHLTLRQWDRTFYYPDWVDPVVFRDLAHDRIFHPVRGLMSKVVAVTDGYLHDQWHGGDPMVVHGDLHEWNVHTLRGRAWVLDFEDVMLALPAQDIATSLYAARARSDLSELVTAFKVGYEEERSWPVEDRTQLETFWAARQVMLMNYAGRSLPYAEARDYFDDVTPWLERFVTNHM